MLLHCQNRKCNAPTDHLLKVDTREVICMSCGTINSNISDMMKNTLKSSGHTYKAEFKKAFMFMCNKCTINREVVLKNGNKVHCKMCDTELHVQPTVIEAIKATAKFADVEPVAPPPTTKAATPPPIPAAKVADTDAAKIKRLKTDE